MPLACDLLALAFAAELMEESDPLSAGGGQIFSVSTGHTLKVLNSHSLVYSQAKHTECTGF